MITLTTWEKTPSGYRMMTEAGEATLTKSGRTWVLEIAGQRVDLGRRASFDHADRVLSTMNVNEER